MTLSQYYTEGINLVARQQWEGFQQLLRKAATLPVAPLPPPKQHSFKYNLPELPSYAPEHVPHSFWDNWWKRPLHQAMEENLSWICPDKLQAAVVSRGGRVDGKVARVCHTLRVGADIGCVGRGRLPTRAENGDSVLEHGQVICDVLQDWVVQGIAAGPLTQAELEENFGSDYTVNKMTTRPKPSGALRIIVDMSAPRDRDGSVPGWLWSPDLPGAVNSSIDADQFPARMSSLRIFVRMLYNVGRGAVVFKIDWSDAYKHVKVSFIGFNGKGGGHCCYR